MRCEKEAWVEVRVGLKETELKRISSLKDDGYGTPITIIAIFTLVFTVQGTISRVLHVFVH